jgi:hypothetical protein
VNIVNQLIAIVIVTVCSSGACAQEKPIYIDSSIEGFSGIPDFEAQGFARSTLVTAWGLFARIGNQYDSDHIDLEVCRRVAHDKAYWKGRETHSIVLNEESLEWNGTDRLRLDHIHDQLIDAVKIYRVAHPGKVIGFYARMPVRDYWTPQLPASHADWAKWRASNRQFDKNLNNETLAVIPKGPACYVDRLYPSLYMSYALPDKMGEYKKFVDANLAEAATYKKPIIAYLSPQQQIDGFPMFPRASWREMLRYVYGHPLVDGISVFVLPTGDTKWNESSEWWLEVMALRSEKS